MSDEPIQQRKTNKRKSSVKRLRRVDETPPTVKRVNKRKGVAKRRGLGFSFRDKNKFAHRKKRKQKKDAIEVCDCDPIGSQGAPLCNDNECANRQLAIECTSQHCKAGDQCCNQRFQLRQYAKFEVFDAGSRGRGIRILEDIVEGQFIMEYVGEVITMDEMYKRSEDVARHHYAMALGKGECIDPSRYGNYARFINHSCAPNCQTEKWSVGAEEVMGIFSLTDIPARTELTFDYQFERVGRKAQRCLCGEDNCVGWIGAKKLKGPRNDDEDEYEDDSEISSASEMSDSEDYDFPFDEQGTFRPGEHVTKKRRKRRDRSPTPPRGPVLEPIDFTVTIGELPMLMRHAAIIVSNSEKDGKNGIFLRRNIARGLAFFSALMIPRKPEEVNDLWTSHRGHTHTPFKLPVKWRSPNDTDAVSNIEQLLIAAKKE